MRRALGSVIAGLIMGFSLSRIGFTSWDEVHAMFTFASLRMTIGFAFAVALLAVSWWLIHRASGARWGARRIHKGTLAGGAIFGVGWAVSGACPSIALVQLGEGQLGAVCTLAGIFVGNWLYSVVHDHYFRWAAATCADE